MLYSIKILLELRSYPAIISYLDSKTSQLTTIQDDFVIVYCIKQPYVTSDFYIAPQAQLDDGYLWLLLLRRKNVNRFKLLKIMLGFHTGHHLDIEGVEMIRTKYFKFEPLCQRSYLTVDGELIDLCTVEAEIVPKAIDVFCKTQNKWKISGYRLLYSLFVTFNCTNNSGNFQNKDASLLWHLF